MPENLAGESKSIQLVSKLLKGAIDGVGPLVSAKDLAEEYAQDPSYKTVEQRVDALIRWETAKNFTTGFLTGLGGLFTLPVAIPAALGASWLLQARLCGAVATLYGHKLSEDRVRSLVLLSLVGDAAKDVLKEAGVDFGKRATLAAIERLPGSVLVEINRRVGFRLIAIAGEKGVVNLTKVVPVLGGVVSGALDGALCVIVGKSAKRIFRPRLTTRALDAGEGV